MRLSHSPFSSALFLALTACSRPSFEIATTDPVKTVSKELGCSVEDFSREVTDTRTRVQIALNCPEEVVQGQILSELSAVSGEAGCTSFYDATTDLSRIVVTANIYCSPK